MELIIRASLADPTHPAILLQLLLLLLHTLRHVLLVHLWILHPQIKISTGELPNRVFCGACLHCTGSGGETSRQFAVTAKLPGPNAYVSMHLISKEEHPATQRI